MLLPPLKILHEIQHCPVEFLRTLYCEVARHHIISDLKEYGWTENDPFPMDEKDYEDMGLF